MMKKNTGAVAIFVETPTLSPIKSVISASLGVETTKELYELSCHATLSILSYANQELVTGGFKPLDIFWAPMENDPKVTEYWRGHQLVMQGEGDQPDRLNRVFETLIKDYEFVIMMYADTPHLSSTLFVKIVSLFAQKDKAKDFIIGPSDYGGYYLFAGRKEVPLYIWNSVSYTDANAINVLAGNLNQWGSVGWIEMQPCLDAIKDVSRIKFLLAQGTNLTPEQMHLRQFLNRVSK